MDAIDEAIAGALCKPSVLGADDCGIWVADIVARMTGRDPASELRGAYRTKAQRDALIRARWRSWPLMLDCVLRSCGYRRRPVSRPARRGDVGLARGFWAAERGAIWAAERGAICIALGGEYWATRGRYGVAFLKGNCIAVAWSIGDGN